MSGIYELVIGGVDQNGAYASNVFHYRIPEDGAHDVFFWAGELADSWQTVNSGALAGCLGSDCTLNISYARRVSAGGGVANYVPIDINGANANSSATLAFAADIIWTPPPASNRLGHTFLWGVPSPAMNAGVWQGGYLAVVSTFIIQQTTAIPLASGGVAEFGVYSKKTGVFTVATGGELKPKPTGFNKRTLPIT